MASVSKQFTAFSIYCCCEKQGKLKLDDDMHASISHGFLTWAKQSLFEICSITQAACGINGNCLPFQVPSGRRHYTEHIVKILSKQKELNFEPGERFLYSNRRIFMLAEIVKAVAANTPRLYGLRDI
jgi:CubicO group peptidase (beta-lactamase class C family)